MEKSKRTINVIGKVCRILAIVMLVLVITSTVCATVAGIFILCQPADLVEMDVKGDAEIALSGRLLEKATHESVDQILQQINNQALAINVQGIRINEAVRDGDRVILSGNGEFESYSFKRVGGALLVLALGLGCLIFVLIMLKKMMTELSRCATPFSDGVVRSMRNFAISLIPYAVVAPTCRSIAGQLISSSSINIDFNVDVSTVFGVLVIFLLVLIFKYGVGLQKESDETL